MLRHRKKPLLKAVKELDAFTKVPEEYQQTNASGGTVSVLTFAVMTWVVCSEVWHFWHDSDIKFRFVPDEDVTDAKMTINIDITIASRCALIGADVLDVLKHTIPTYDALEEEDTWFEMTPKQREYFNNMQQVNTYLREDYHSVAQILFKSRFQQMGGGLPERSQYEMHVHQRVPQEVLEVLQFRFQPGFVIIRHEVPDQRPDACRFHGSLEVNKIDGNLHIIQGKVLPIPLGHAHIGVMGKMNYSHRINHLSFGDPAIGIISPLDGDEKLTDIEMTNFQYFIKIVPTEISTGTFGKTNYTYQYSVTEQAREIDHSKGSHGMAGIFFKYELSPIKVQVFEESESLFRFCVRLCAIVGGIYATSGVIYGLLQFLYETTLCKRITPLHKAFLDSCSSASTSYAELPTPQPSPPMSPKAGQPAATGASNGVGGNFPVIVPQSELAQPVVS